MSPVGSHTPRLDMRRESGGLGTVSARSLAIVRYADEHRAEPWRDIDPVDVDDQESLDDELLTVLAKRRPT